mgnify:CR=1 FL=1
MLTTTKELDKVRNQIRSLEEELARAKEFGVLMSKIDHDTSSGTEPLELANLQKKASEMDAEPVARKAPEKDVETEHEMQTLREELGAQEALRERERE